VIVAIALGAALLFGTMVPRTKDAEAFARNENTLANIRTALQQFALIRARLPCPANGLAATGLEDVTGDTCNSPFGVIPWTTLGLQESVVVDSWGRLISYRVFDGASGFTRTGGLLLSDCQDSDVTPTIGLTGAGGTCDSTSHKNSRSDFFAGKGISVNDHGTLVASVAYVLLSHGPTGLGGYAPDASGRLPLPTSAAESANTNSGGTYWVIDPTPELPAENANHFDDIVGYTRANAFVVSAGIGGRSWPASVIPTPGILNSSTHVIQDFRFDRRVLKLVIGNITNSDSVDVTYYKSDGAQVTQTINGCQSAPGSFRFVRQLPTPGESFTKVDISTSGATTFTVQELVACKYDDSACTFSVPGTDC